DDFWVSDSPAVEARSPDHVPAEWATDPVLGAKHPLRLEAPADPWASVDVFTGKPAIRLCDVLPRIAETYGINLVADAYRSETYGPYMPHDYRPLPGGEEW